MKWIAKIGYGARGVVYAAVAYFAVLAALGRSEMVDTHGALKHVSHLPLGEAMVALIIVGLAAFCLWRLLQAVFDVDGHGRTLSACLVRVALLISAAVHGALASWALGLLIRQPGSSSDSAVGWTSQVLAQPWGRWMVAAAALTLAGVAVAHVRKALTHGFLRYLESSANRRGLILVSQLGLVARGVMFLLFAYFATRAAWHVDPGQSKDMVHLLRWTQSLPGARIWAGSVAVGLGAFAIYSLLQGWFRIVTSAGARQDTGTALLTR